MTTWHFWFLVSLISLIAYSDCVDDVISKEPTKSRSFARSVSIAVVVIWLGISFIVAQLSEHIH